MNDRVLPRTKESEGSATLPPLAAPLDGVSTSLFAGLAVVAVVARVLAPALPGSATGIAKLISVTTFVAACSSQLIAAGGIALCLRALAGLWPWPNLGVALRTLIVPITFGVIAFTVTSAARPLAAEFGRITALAAILASVASAPLLCSSRRTRTLGIVLFLSGLGGAFALGAYEIALRPSRLLGAESARVSAALGLFLDAGATLFGLAWLAVKNRAALAAVAVTLGVVLGAAWLARNGVGQGAESSLVVLHRSLEGLAARPVLALPSLLSHPLALLPLAGAAAVLLIGGRQPELRAAIALCLLGRTATGAPVAALLSVGAVLIALALWLHGTPRPARQSVAKLEGAPSTAE